MKTEDGSVVLPPGEGKAVSWPGHRVTFIHRPSDAAYSLIEWAAEPNVPGPPLHVHEETDEAFYVLDGELLFHVDGRDIAAGAGAWVTLARGSLHHFKNLGDRPARMLIVVTPAGLERYFLEVGRAATDGDGNGESLPPTPEDIERLLAVAPQYGIEIRLPEWE